MPHATPNPSPATPRPPQPDGIFRRAAQTFAARRATLYFDLSTLHEDNWTGIPVVAAGLARALRATLPNHVRFFSGYDVIDTAYVDAALQQNSGLFLHRDITQGHALAGKLPVSRDTAAGLSIGLFPSVKPMRGTFDVEASVFHDLSTLVMPLMHIRGNVVHHMEALMADLASDDLVITVSEACKTDLMAYLGVPQTRIAVVPNGVEWPDWYEPAALNMAGASDVEPYLLILGTREPRKNIMKVFDLLEHAPELLQTHRFVFAGKMGWLEEQHALPRGLEPHVASGRILFPGFIGELEKYTLLRFAKPPSTHPYSKASDCRCWKASPSAPPAWPAGAPASPKSAAPRAKMASALISTRSRPPISPAPCNPCWPAAGPSCRLHAARGRRGLPGGWPWGGFWSGCCCCRLWRRKKESSSFLAKKNQKTFENCSGGREPLALEHWACIFQPGRQYQVGGFLGVL